MNEWLLKNTTISENDYENIMQYRDIPKGEYYLSKNPKKQNLNVLINFTLNHPTILNCMKYKIKKTYKKIYHGSAKRLQPIWYR